MIAPQHESQPAEILSPEQNPQSGQILQPAQNPQPGQNLQPAYIIQAQAPILNTREAFMIQQKR